MARNQRSKNNNPTGRNQYSGGVLDVARDRPMTAALGAAAAVGAGVFLWSRRNQISEQLANLSDQIVEWKDDMTAQDSDDFGTDALVTGTGGTGSSANMGTKSRRSKGKTQVEIAEEALTLKETGAAI